MHYYEILSSVHIIRKLLVQCQKAIPADGPDDTYKTSQAKATNKLSPDRYYHIIISIIIIIIMYRDVTTHFVIERRQSFL